jgi:PPM family protein phosphatase
MSAPPPFADTGAGLAVPMEIELAILSQPGGRGYNEDACGHWHSGTQLCCVVADGAGGHGGGDIASKLAVQYLIEACAAAPVAAAADVRRLLVEANGVILDHHQEGGVQQNMHSTVIALFVDLALGLALWGHCGDSRLYVFRGGALAQRTRDHSLVQALVDAGMLAETGMRAHPQRSELLSALGTEGDELLIGTSQAPWRLRAGDVFLLCTDGLWEYVEDDALQRSLAAAAEPHDWLAALEALVLRNAAHKPNHDNYSALTVWIRDAAATLPAAL